MANKEQCCRTLSLIIQDKYNKPCFMVKGQWYINIYMFLKGSNLKKGTNSYREDLPKN
jgi:hypothetical protein